MDKSLLNILGRILWLVKERRHGSVKLVGKEGNTFQYGGENSGPNIKGSRSRDCNQKLTV